MTYLAQQLDLEPEIWNHYDWHGRAIKYHRAQIRQSLRGHRRRRRGAGHLAWHAGPHQHASSGPCESGPHQRCRDLRIEPPTPDRVERLIRSALHQFETQLGERVLHRLSPQPARNLTPWWSRMRPQKMRSNLRPPIRPGRITGTAGGSRSGESGESLARNDQIERVRDSTCPWISLTIWPKVLQAYRQRVAVEAPYELRRHPEALRMTLLAVLATVAVANSPIP